MDLPPLADLKATQRATGKALGVTQPTIQGDLKSDKKLSKGSEEPLKIQDKDEVSDKSLSTPAILTKSGADVVKLTDKAARNQDEEGPSNPGKDFGEAPASEPPTERTGQ